MTTNFPSVGSDGSLRLILMGRQQALSLQQLRILTLLWQTAAKQLPSAGIYALLWQTPFSSARLTQTQRTSTAMSVRRLYTAGLVVQPRPLWLGLTGDGIRLMEWLTHEWAGWEDYQRRYLDPD